ncbi:MAG: hypothetical protein JSU07_14220 [Bacteroidetes bacterium]|nr:hypothetical protein [Bacteroidota bacterium]
MSAQVYTKKDEKITLKHLYVIIFIAISISSLAQSNENISSKEEAKKQLRSKQIMMASLGIFQGPAGFLTNNAASQYRSYWYHDSYFILGVGQGKALQKSAYYSNSFDTISYSDFSIGANFNFKKLNIGRRLWDINGAMLTPLLGVAANNLTYNSNSYWGLKIIPAISFQLPYLALEARLNIDYRPNATGNLKTTSFYPEIGIRLDGLYNVFDPELVLNGHYEGSEIRKTESYYTMYEKDPYDSRNTVEVRVHETKYWQENYNFDAYARNVGPFVAIGPRFTFNNLAYCGASRMYGIGYYARMPMFGADAFADYGKLGFASSFKTTQSISNAAPGVAESDLNKKDFKFTGTYSATRLGLRVGIDLIEALMKAKYRYHSSDAGTNATKFTRLQVGFGGGYTFINNTTFDKSYATHYKDSLISSNYQYLNSAYNDARYSENTSFITWFASLEVGAVQLSWEWYRYKYAPLANCHTFTLAYMLPYNRLAKKYKALRLLKKNAY